MDIGQRDLSAGDVVADTFRAWFNNFGQVFVVSLMFTIPVFVVNALVLTSLPEAPEDIENIELGNFLVRTLGGSFISIVLGFLLTAALSYAFLKIFHGEVVDPGETAGGVFGIFGTIALFAIIAGFLTAIGFIFFVIPGLLAVIVFSLGVPAIINERIGATDAISRSLRLISGSWGIALGVVLLGFLINLLLVFVVGGISAPGALSYPTFANFDIARSLVQMGVSALVAPLIPALSTALYFQLKGRTDGFPSTEPPPPQQPYI